MFQGFCNNDRNNLETVHLVSVLRGGTFLSRLVSHRHSARVNETHNKTFMNGLLWARIYAKHLICINLYKLYNDVEEMKGTGRLNNLM